MYSYIKDDNENRKIAQGIKKIVVKRLSDMKTTKTHYSTGTLA